MRSPRASADSPVSCTHPKGTRTSHARDGLKRFLKTPPVQIGLGRGLATAEGFGPASVQFEHGYHPVVLIERQAAKNYRIDHRKYRGPRPDSQRQNGQGNRGEGRGRTQRPHGVSQILFHDGLDGRAGEAWVGF